MLKTRIPDSILPFPEATWDRVKFIFWRTISPFFIQGQGFLFWIGAIKHGGRQPFKIGRLKTGKTVDEFLKYLERTGFGNHFIAWEDDGQIASVRKLDGFEGQYHLRIFRDGEIRAHYEFTPEAHPVWHLKEVGMEPRRDEFVNAVGDWVALGE